MKIILAEFPETANRDLSIEYSVFPNDADISVAVYTPETESDFIEKCADADGIITGYAPINAKIIDGLKKCKVISVQAKGWNYVDAVYAKEKGIAVCAVGEYCTNEVADHAMMLILALNKYLMTYRYHIENDHEWMYSNVAVIKPMDELTIGILGFGKIGRAVAKRALAFGMKVIAYDPYVSEDIFISVGAKNVSIDEILEQSNVISVHMNLTGENTNFFTYDVFKKMKKQPIFINVARGGAVNEPDLARALDEGLLSGAGLDVLSSETPDLDNNLLLGRQNVIITPHSAFYSDRSTRLVYSIPADNALKCILGNHKETNVIVNGIGL